MFSPGFILPKARFTIYVNVDTSRRNDIAGIELKSILTCSHVITPAERPFMHIVNPDYSISHILFMYTYTPLMYKLR